MNSENRADIVTARQTILLAALFAHPDAFRT